MNISENFIRRPIATSLLMAAIGLFGVISYRALPVSDHQRLIREMILQLKTGKLDASYFRKKFGVEIASEFSDGFDSLVEEKLATVDGDQIALTRDGLLRVDTLLPRFFEPQFRGVRYT